MKIALYIEDGLEQIVLTPESATERGILEKLHDGSRQFTLKRGSFYETRGDWMRYAPQTTCGGYYEPTRSTNDESTMIVLRAMRDSEPDADCPTDCPPDSEGDPA